MTASCDVHRQKDLSFEEDLAARMRECHVDVWNNQRLQQEMSNIIYYHSQTESFELPQAAFVTDSSKEHNESYAPSQERISELCLEAVSFL